MIVILAGPDGSGKTTLANRIQERYPWYKYVHVGPPKTKRPFEEYKRLLLDVGPDTVLDRSFYSERVYGPLYRGKSGVSRAQLLWLELLARTRGVVVVGCTATPEVLKARLEERKTEERLYSDYDQRFLKNLDAVLSGFEQTWDEARLPVYRFDSGIGVSQTLISSLGLGLSYSSSHLLGVGQTLSPRVCLVGDRLFGFERAPPAESKRWSEDPWVYARPFDRGPGSEFLLECLLDASYGAKDVYLTNSRFPQLKSWEAALEAELLATAPRTLVALGKHAALRLGILGRPHVQMPHPQYWRRFQWRRRDMYVAQLKEILQG